VLKKRTLTNRSNTVGDGNTGQSVVPKRIIPNGGYAVGDGYTFYSNVLERFLTNSNNRVTPNYTWNNKVFRSCSIIRITLYLAFYKPKITVVGAVPVKFASGDSPYLQNTVPGRCLSIYSVYPVMSFALTF
jgi:hypothetical protein